jgi:hypothetical protein
VLAPAGDGNDRRSRVFFLNDGDDADPAYFWHHKVCDHEVNAFFVLFENFEAIQTVEGRQYIVILAEEAFQPGDSLFAIVDNQ